MEPVDRDGRTEREWLEQYRPGEYERPSVAADMAVFTVTSAETDNYRKLPEKELRLLLIRRGGHPFLGKWALPGGFVRPDETAEQAAARELREETGVSDVYLEQLGTFTEVGRDPRAWVMSCSYMALIDSARVQVQAGDDAEEAAWFKVGYRLLREQKEQLDEGCVKTWTCELKLRTEEEELTAVVERTVTAKPTSTSVVHSIASNDGLAFDHAKIIACAIERLREQTNGTDIALNLMPGRFTLTELQQVYEVILGKELLKAAFRRKVADLVTETDHYADHAGHRPSRLFRRNWEGV
ncbi:ADP-ribose pyrophosphatase [Paenibacillus pasadenensis]|uniref:ADP-ribose pyrophosphatase n=1 Tax=Paenibacillus pasadenensis TaxID=217090 RepID=A0A2N5NCE2_9BACL|nr:NUDIX domain-containing protein [Paenibacillus pasadenensis]PLT48019.1 ADP-ribose pyrophosphatase [Paenibacillus pasadenensis]